MIRLSHGLIYLASPWIIFITKPLVYTFDMNEETNKQNHPLADRLNRLMQQTGVNKSGLARICGVTPQSVGKWFKNGSISKESAMKIAEAFGVSLSWLLDDDALSSSEVVLEEEFQPLTITERQKMLLHLFERLPESEKDHHIEALRVMVDNYDKLFSELLKSRNIDEIIQAKKVK